ncbi:MAG: glycoside hydrolase family protein [Anaerolineae bacterium]|nr:glycoside hydrolase family protein [Anaerolineae bacterium]
MAVFTALQPANPLPPSQAQGYPPPVTSTPTPASLSGYPAPPATYPIQTATPLSFTVSHNYYIPITVSNLPLKKGMVWNYYLAGTNTDPWNVMNIGWFHRYAPTYGQNDYHGPIQFIPYWGCNTLSVEYMVNTLGGDYAGYLIWLNEPDTGMPDGCPPLSDPQAAADFYIAARAGLPYAKFIGPHTYHGNPAAHNRAMNWMREWRDKVRDHPNGNGQYPDVTGYGIHPYSTDPLENMTFVDNFYNQMVDWGEGEKELWVTEFAYCDEDSLTADITYTVNAFETRTYVDRYAYWVDWRPTPTPAPILTVTPGANDNDDSESPLVPMGYCVELENTIPLFRPGFNTLTTAGETYRHLGR